MNTNRVQPLSLEEQALHVQAEGFWPVDAADVPASEWSTRCTAGVLHSPERESVVCLCGFDTQEWPQSSETSDGLEVSDLPGVQRLAVDGVGLGNAEIPAEGVLEQLDGVESDLSTHDPLGVDGDGAVSTDTHGIGTSLDADGPVGVDDASEISKEEFGSHAVLTSGGDVTAPVYRDQWLEVYGGDCRDVMRTLPAESVHCVVTSPP